MARQRFRDFSGGFVPSGPRESIPRNAVRRARGLWPIRTPSLRSRFGTALVDTVASPPHSFARFNGIRYYGVGTGLYKGSAPLGVPAQSQAPYAFLVMPPTVGLADYLFVAGGGVLFKVGPAFDVSSWGILPPFDGFVSLSGTPTPTTKVIDSMDSAANWTAGATMVADPTVKLEGTNSLKPNAALANGTATTFANTAYAAMNLNEFTPTLNDSPDEDWISVSIRIDHPRLVRSIAMTFGKDANFNNGFTFSIIIEDDVSHVGHHKKRTGRRRRGLADHPVVNQNEATFIASSSGLPLNLLVSQLIGEDRTTPNDNTWAVLKIPKNAFTTVGNATDWTAITALKFDVNTNSLFSATTTVWFDDIKLVGGVGMQGDYQYLFTYKNSVTKSRSNPNLSVVTVKGVQRASVSLVLAAGMVSTDPQVDTIEVWRTFGNGAVFFHNKSLPNTAQTYVDGIADYIGLHSGTSAFGVLGTEVLPLDNVEPPNSFVDVVGPHYGRAFWLDSGTNRVYYSPPGRPESVAGFVDFSSFDDTVQKLVIWNDTVYVWASHNIFLIAGTTEPFVPIQVPGGRGTLWPRSVTATDHGVFFRAIDGPRVFDGSRTIRLGVETFGQLYYGVNAENLTPLGDPVDTTVRSVGGGILRLKNNTVACWTGEEWLLTDGVQTWAWNVMQERWSRDFGIGYSFLAYEEDTGFLLAGLTGGQVGQLEAPGTFDDLGVPIPFDVMPASLFFRSAEKAMVQRLFVELNAGGNTIIPFLSVDGVETALPSITSLVQQAIELPIEKAGTVFGVRFTGALVGAPVEIVSVEWDGPDVEAEQEA